MQKPMTNRSILIVILFLYAYVVLASPIYGKEEAKQVRIHYFYSNVCHSCTEAMDLIHDYMGTLAPEDKEYSLSFIYYNVVEVHNLEKMHEFFEVYDVPEERRRYPIMFYGDNYYEGTEAIEQAIKHIDKELEEGVFSPSRDIDSYNESVASPPLQLGKWIQVVGIGIVNGLNPCALSMLLFLMTLCMAKKNINILKVGTAFAIGKVVTYILLGTIMYQFLSLMNMDSYRVVTKIILSIYLIIIVGMNLLDWYHAKNHRYGDIKNQLPSGLRKFNHKMLSKLEGFNKTSSFLWMSMVLGVIISVGEFLCTGQVYMATIVYLFQKDTALSMQAFIYLCLYAVSFVIPLMVVIIIIHKTRTTMIISNRLLEKLPWIKLITAILLSCIGLLIILYT